jgi:hypothetical protein
VRHAYHAASAIDFNLGHHGDVGSKRLVSGESYAAAARAVARLARFPAGFLRHRFNDRPRARVGEVGEPEGDRIDAGGERQFVHEGFDGEYVGIAAERAQRGHPDRHLRDEMIHDPVIGQIVARNRVAIAAARGERNVACERPLLRLREAPAREQIASIRGAGPNAVRPAPQLVLPIENPAVSNGAPGLHHHGRAVRLPPKLVVAHPLHPHRPARDGTGEQRRVERDVVMTVAAIATGSLGEDAANGRGFDLQGLGEVEAQRKYPLRLRPDRESPVAEFGERAGRPHGGMREIRLAVRCLHEARAAGRRACPLLAGNRVDAAQGEQMIIDFIRIGQFGAP